jgi:hypothetical protein
LDFRDEIADQDMVGDFASIVRCQVGDADLTPAVDAAAQPPEPSRVL